MFRVGPEEFDELVGEALDLLPDGLLDLMENVAVVTEDHPPEPDLLGLYEGVPLTERGDYGAVLPDKISVYRMPLCEMAGSRVELVDEIRVTVLHEVAHHFGIDDDRLTELGWD